MVKGVAVRKIWVYLCRTYVILLVTFSVAICVGKLRSEQRKDVRLDELDVLEEYIPFRVLPVTVKEKIATKDMVYYHILIDDNEYQWTQEEYFQYIGIDSVNEVLAVNTDCTVLTVCYTGRYIGSILDDDTVKFKKYSFMGDTGFSQEEIEQCTEMARQYFSDCKNRRIHFSPDYYGAGLPDNSSAYNKEYKDSHLEKFISLVKEMMYKSIGYIS